MISTFIQWTHCASIDTYRITNGASSMSRTEHQRPTRSGAVTSRRLAPTDFIIYPSKATEPKDERFKIVDRLLTRTYIHIRRDRFSMYTSLISGVTFTICWTPYFVYLIINMFCGMNCFVRYEFLLVNVGTLNSLLNPIIYVAFNRNFRENIINKLKHCR